MGNKCAPAYANIFMGNFEQKFIFALLKEKSLAYQRFINDIFLISTGSKEELQKFLHDINEVHNSIKFESTYSKEYFLDNICFIN